MHLLDLTIKSQYYTFKNPFKYYIIKTLKAKRFRLQLFNVYENGALRKIDKLDFADHKVFLIDDENKIYLWYGKKSSQNKRKLSERRAQKLINSRAKKTDLEILHQGNELGSFLTMIEPLKKGFSDKDRLEKRKELKIKVNDTLELIEAGITPDFEGEITIDAHKLSEEKKSYEELCRILAELQLELISTGKKIKSAEIEKKAIDIYRSSSTYDELCWLIAELRLLKQKKDNA